MSTTVSKIEQVSHERMAASWFDYVSTKRRGGRRRERGRPPRCQVQVVVDGEGSVSYDVFDLSSTGVYLNSQFLFSPGEEFELVFSLGEGDADEPLRLTGEVVRTQMNLTRRPPGMAVAFRDVHPTDRRALEDYIDRLRWRRSQDHGR